MKENLTEGMGIDPLRKEKTMVTKSTHLLNQIRQSCRITVFIIIPSQHLHKITDDGSELRIKNTGVRIAYYIRRNDRVLCIFQDSFQICFGRFFKRIIYFLRSSMFF